MNEIFSYDTKRRIKSIKNVKVDEAKKTVLYWMERDQRVSDNWALIAASEFAAKYNMSLKVVFFLTKNLLGNELRRFHFLINGLVETNEKLRLLNKTTVTNAAVLLFAKNGSIYNVHLGRFKTPSMIIDDKMLRLTLFDAVEETQKYLISQMKVAFEITGITT